MSVELRHNVLTPLEIQRSLSALPLNNGDVSHVAYDRQKLPGGRP